MVNLLKISIIFLILIMTCACSSNQISNKKEINDIQYNYEDMYLENIKELNINDNKIIIDSENWKIMKSNLIKIHYHILKIQTQLNNI